MKKEKQITLVIFSFLLSMLCPMLITSQNYLVKVVRIGTLGENVYGPFISNGYLYYCSDKKTNSVKSYVNEDGSSFTDIFRVKVEGKKLKGKKEHLDGLVNSVLNDGPVHLTNGDSLMYFTRNLNNSIDDVPKLGIFYSKNIDDTLRAPIPFQFNDISYSVAHPTLSKDEKFMVFSSNMPGGYGRADLYFSEFIDNKWSDPINFGPTVNTDSSESFPYLYNEQLFFSSDRVGGYGNKDIYRISKTKAGWSNPMLLKEPINSTADDFSIYLIDGIQEGYLSTNRKKEYDHILYFKSKLPKPDTFVEVEPDFCYIFSDEEFEYSKDIILQWDFGDGIIDTGNVVNHCFSKIGNYNIKLNVVDNNIDLTYPINDKELSISTNDMPYIVHEELNGKHLFYADKSTCQTNYDQHYWNVGGVIYNDEKIEVKLDGMDVKYISWSKSSPEKAIGIIKKY